MIELANATPFAADLAPGWDQSGADVVIVAAKATFSLSHTPVLAAEQASLCRAYVHSGVPGASSLLAVPELTLPSGGTDLVLTGDAWAPGGRAASVVDTALCVGARRRRVRVWGDRVWRSYALNVASRPLPFVHLPLCYERALGGTFIGPAGRESCYADNPLGCGVRGPRSRRAMRGTPLPNLELLTERGRPGSVGQPAGYGYVAPHWPGRRNFAGTYDDSWQAQRAPYLPADYDPRFECVGPTDLFFAEPLRGGELVVLQHLAAQPWLQFALPTHRLMLRGGPMLTKPLPLDLAVVAFEPNYSRFTMLYKVAVPCDKKWLTVGRMRLDLL